MRRGIAAALLLLSLGACHPQSAEPKVREAWVRLPAVAGQPAAAYLTIQGGRSDKTLIRLESALAAKAEMHASMKGMDGMATMAPLDHVDIPAGKTVMFKPGANHIMLIGLDPVVKPGTAVPIRLGFSDGTTAEAEAKSVSAGEDPPY
jgi:periplasmic copper chaperone A